MCFRGDDDAAGDDDHDENDDDIMTKDGEDDGAETAAGKKNLQIFAKADETPKVSEARDRC